MYLLAEFGVTRFSAASLLLSFTALLMIWFPNAVGRLDHDIGRARTTAPEPAVLVAAGGWLFLIGAPVLLYFARRAVP